MILILVLTMLAGFIGVSSAQDAPAPVDPIAKAEILQTQNAILRRQNALMAQKIQLEEQVRAVVEKMNTEGKEIARLQEEVNERVSKLLDGHSGWALNQNLEWVAQPAEKKDGGG